MTIPAVMIKFVVLAVLFHLNSARKWHAALKSCVVPQTLLNWLGVRSLDALTEECRFIKPILAQGNTEHGSSLGKFRWVVELH